MEGLEGHAHLRFAEDDRTRLARSIHGARSPVSRRGVEISQGQSVGRTGRMARATQQCWRDDLLLATRTLAEWTDRASAVLTFDEIHAKTLETLDELDRLVSEQLRSGEHLAQTERDFKVKFARSRMSYKAEHEKATGPQAEDYATVTCEQELFDYTLATQRVSYVRAARSAAEHRLDSLRSMGAALRGVA
jgi:hypothetical protein